MSAKQACVGIRSATHVVVVADQLLEARIFGEDTLVSLELEVTILDRNIREEAGLIQPTSD
jgi:hypothetical protein